MKKTQSNFKLDELKPLAIKKIAEKAGSKYVVTTEPEKDELSTGEAVFLFRGYDAADPNGNSYELVMDSKGAELSKDKLEKTEKRALFLSAVTEINKELLLPFAVATEHISISPDENKLTLKECETFEEEITVTIPKDSNRKIDIYFLADTTGSMTGILAAVKSGANNILNAAYGSSDIAFGIGNYRDFTDPAPHPFQHQLSPTTNKAAASAAINTWNAAGGGDEPEAQLFALKGLAVPPGGTIGWRPDSKRIIVWFGDQPGHDPSGGPTQASVIAALKAENISVIAISVGANLLNASGQATAITSATGGSFQSGINTTNIVNTIITMINNLVSVINNVSLVAAGGTAPFVTYISPAGGYGPLRGDRKHVLTFKVTFTGVRPCDDKDQLYHGSLDVVADGIVVARKKVEIRVPACCKKRRYSYSVKYVIGSQEQEECTAKMPVNAGNYTTEINIHNYQQKEAVIEKHIVPLVYRNEAIGREPRYAKVMANDKIVLPPHTATMDDTYRLAELLYDGRPPCKLPLGIGFLHIISNIKLSVTAVYTASGLKEGGVSSIDVEEVSEKEIPLENLRRDHLTSM